MVASVAGRVSRDFFTLIVFRFQPPFYPPDVVKALCLGAKAVGLGRQFLYAQSVSRSSPWRDPAHGLLITPLL